MTEPEGVVTATSQPVANPAITPAEFVLLVPKLAKDSAGNLAPYTHPARRRIVLQVAGAAFDGRATFSCGKPALARFYRENGSEITFNGTDNVFEDSSALAAGIGIEAEAVQPSSDMNDLALKLSLSGGTCQNGPDFVARATCVEVTLDIWDRPRLEEGALTEGEPRPLSTYDKIRDGARLFIRSSAGRFERAKLVIQQVKPPTFNGALILTADKGATAYADEKSARPEAPLSGEIPATAISRDGLVFWAEGLEDISSPSGKKKFVGKSCFRLKVKGIEDTADVVHVTIRPNVFLTFDDGPTAACEPVVRELDAAGFRATFFVNMQNVEAKPEEQRRILDLILASKHTLASHGYVHAPYLQSQYNAAIKNAEAETRKARELNPESPKKDPAEGIIKNFALNDEKAKALLGSAFPGFELGRLPGAGSKSKFQESDGTPVDFVERLVRGLKIHHVAWDFEFFPNGTFGSSKGTKVDWHGIPGVSAEATNDRLPARNEIIILLHDAHWAGKADRLRALFTVLRNEANVIPLLPPPEGHRSIAYPPGPPVA